MPNWVYNSLVVSGEKSELEKMVAQLNKPVTKNFPDTNYNKETEKWEQTPATQHYSNPVFSFWNIVSPTDLESYYGEEKVKVELDNFAESFTNALQNGEDWYYWNLRNWGTKWDVCVKDNDEYSNTTMEWTDEDSVMYHFETAWSPVLEVLTKLSEMYPSLEFDYEYEEEQGWGGEAQIVNGELESHSEYDIPESHQDYVDRGREDSCPCNWYDDDEETYSDCPKMSQKTLDNAPSI